MLASLHYMLTGIKEVLIYVTIFIGLYFQVFLLISYFFYDGTTEFGEIDEVSGELYEPTVAIMVPCYNEENTVAGTIHSLLAMDYPREKLRIVAIDDGSKDGTWAALQEFKDNISVVLLQKQNEGSKFAALNYGLAAIMRDIPDVGVIGCLDADSHVDVNALRASMREFTKPGVMAVVPSMVIDRPKSFFQILQKVEYELSNYSKQVYSRLNTLYIAPGPFSMFRREVFDRLGNYHEAHHVEDMEMALRMQLAGMRLSHAVDSIVYTKGPRTWSALLKQRVRWTYGFIMNVWDYRGVYFKSSIGDLAVMLPFLFLTTFISVLFIPFMIMGFVVPIVTFFERYSVTHQIVSPVHFDVFYLNTQVYTIMSYITVGILLITIFIGRKSLLRQRAVSWDLLVMIAYPFFSAWWTGLSAYNAVRGKKKSWR